MRKLISSFISMLALLSLLLLPLPALAKGGVVLNFSDVDISTMVKFISDLTGKNFVMDDRVKGKISVFSPAKLSNDDAFNVFISVLELKGFTVVQAGKVYKIVPTSSAKQSGMKILTEKDRGTVNEAYVARVVTLERISSQEAMTFLQPVVSKDGYISSFGPANMLLVVDSALNIQKILGIVKLIDTDQKREEGELVFLKNAGAESVGNVLKEWLGSKSKMKGGGAQPSGATVGAMVIPDSRLNALLIFGSTADKEDIRKMIALIDVVPPTTSSKVNVYYMEYGEAVEVAKVLEGVVKGTSSTPAQPGTPGATGVPIQSPFEGGKISITPDKSTNSLVIMASPTDYQNLLQVIQKLDRRSRQVYVEAMIAEVSLDKLSEAGVQWGVFGGAANNTVSTAGVYDPFGTFAPLLSTLGSLNTAGISNDNITLKSAANFPVILKALQSNGTLNVLSTPNIMTSDNKEAEIFVGENVPFLSQSNVITGGVSQQSVDRKDTGITLKIKPQVSAGEYVKLEIYQEISAVKDAKGNAVDITTTKRSAKTTVVVKDTETVAIGGLIQDQDQETINKVPILGDIPLLGWFFKTRTVKRQKTNLLIMLTPKIVKEPQDLTDISRARKNSFDEAITKDKAIDFKKELNIK